jgi:hypothetical protein
VSTRLNRRDRRGGRLRCSASVTTPKAQTRMTAMMTMSAVTSRGRGTGGASSEPGELEGDEGAPAEDEAEDRGRRDDAAEGGGHEG